MIIERRHPDSLKLESLILSALVRAEWTGEEIAGFIAAQRRDGILAHNTNPYVLEIEIKIWDRATPGHVRVQCRLPEAKRISMRAKYKWICEYCGAAADYDIEEKSCPFCKGNSTTTKEI